MKVCVVGLGYIGLPTALSLAACGTETVGVDKKKDILDSLNQGRMTFQEDGMEALFEKAKNSGNFAVSETCIPADVYIIAVPTPYLKITKQIEPKYVLAAVSDVLKAAPKGAVMAIESTISPGTIDKFVRPAILEQDKKIGEDIHIAHVPERIIPGNMLYELEHNSRTIGVDSPSTAEILKKIYGTFCKGDMIVTDIKTAEMAKVVENTYRDINIAFANELAKMCNRAGMDVYEIIKVANMHPRVNILTPGPGVGGHCISVDPWFLVGDYPDIVNIIRQARLINDEMPEYVLDRVSSIMKQNGIKDLSEVGFYGLTYKEDVDDTRESPTLQLIECMERHLAMGAKFYDPMVKKTIVDHQCHDFDEFLKDIKLMVVMVGHSHLKENTDKVKDKIIYDTRNCVNGENVYRL